MYYNMFSQKAVLLVIVGVLLTAKSCLSTSKGEITEEILNRELDRFIAVKDLFEENNLNVSVSFTQVVRDEDGDIIKYDAVQFRPLISEYNPSGPETEDEIDDAFVEKVLKFAEKLNTSGVLSRETFLEDGTPDTKDIYAEDLTIHLKNGFSFMSFKDTQGEMEGDSNEMDDFLSNIKDYEFPLNIVIDNYDSSGNIYLSSIDIAIPDKVKIDKVIKMPLSMQLTAAEALKRSFGIKKTPEDRMALVCKYLGMEYSSYTFDAALGSGNHYIDSVYSIVLTVKNETYTIWAQEAEE